VRGSEKDCLPLYAVTSEVKANTLRLIDTRLEYTTAEIFTLQKYISN